MIGKFRVVIDDYNVPRVLHLQVYQFTRDETRTTSFAGTERVDRSALKYRVSFVISICTADEMQRIVSLASGIVQTASFPDGTSDVTKDMIISLPEVPEPIYKYGNKLRGVYYTDLRVDMEET